jgi:non-ribosomal peptide synthetase component F
MIIAVMGVMKAGGAYVPLDAMYARERLPIIMQDAECPVLLTQRSMLDAVPRGSAEVIALDSDWDLIERESSENVRHETTWDTLAYVVYTSGSTGVPKGVMVTHGGLLNQYRGSEECYGLKLSAGSWLYMANFSFDVFSSDLVRTLCSGGKMVICPTELLLNPSSCYVRRLTAQSLCQRCCVC